MLNPDVSYATRSEVREGAIVGAAKGLNATLLEQSLFTTLRTSAW
jgi:hypothetical protein